MGREIKFRGLSVENKIWYFGDLQQNSIGDTWISELDCGEGDRGYFINVNPKTVGEFTGLKDKNGVEICEGDILKHNDNIFQVIHSSNRHVLVLRDLVKETNWRDLHWCNNVTKYIEVIGNIHKNPELLKE